MLVKIDDDFTDEIVLAWLKDHFWMMHPLNSDRIQWWREEDIQYEKEVFDAFVKILEYTMPSDEADKFFEEIATRG